MTKPFQNDEQWLAQLIRAAGDPAVATDPQYAQRLRAEILQGVVAAQPSDQQKPAGGRTGAPTVFTTSRNRNMKRMIRLAVAMTILVGLVLLVSRLTGRGGEVNIALANVAEALDTLRSATFDIAGEVKDLEKDKTIRIKAKGMFLAPSRQRTETNVEGVPNGSSVMIMDLSAGKGLMLSPMTKMAITVDSERMKKAMENGKGRPSPNIFDMARRLVREGAATGEKVERLGTKEFDGRPAVGFRTGRSDQQEMVLWVDPQTALPIRMEIDIPAFSDGRMVMDNFHYDVNLDPSLFSLDPPSGYTVQAMSAAMPTEEGLIEVLRVIVKHNRGLFPAKLGMTPEVMKCIGEAMQPDLARILMKYGKDGQKNPEAMKEIVPLGQKYTTGIMFPLSLKPGNDWHYTGGGVKLGTPDRPIFWYKPTDAEKYRVIYADLSVKEVTSEEAKKLPPVLSK